MVSTGTVPSKRWLVGWVGELEVLEGWVGGWGECGGD